MKFLCSEQLSAHKYKTPEGYLVCVDSVLSRTGKQSYMKKEVFNDSDDETEIEINRTEKEVFDPRAIASFENKPITVEHPDVDVNTGNYKEYSVGFVRDVHQGEENGNPVMMGTLVITDEQTIKEIENGEHTQLSCGYDCDIVDMEQKNIRGNHVALCQQGRAGNARIVDSVNDGRGILSSGQWDKVNKYAKHYSFTPDEIYKAIEKLHNQKPYMDLDSVVEKVLDNIANSNYLLDSDSVNDAVMEKMTLTKALWDFEELKHDAPKYNVDTKVVGSEIILTGARKDLVQMFWKEYMIPMHNTVSMFDSIDDAGVHIEQMAELKIKTLSREIDELNKKINNEVRKTYYNHDLVNKWTKEAEQKGNELDRIRKTFPYVDSVKDAYAIYSLDKGIETKVGVYVSDSVDSALDEFVTDNPEYKNKALIVKTKDSIKDITKIVKIINKIRR